MNAWEVNFDGLVGLTHSYAGLSYGNIASQRHAQSASSPRAAALQGLDKMKWLCDMGLRQAVLPPQERPALGTLRRLGFAGSDEQVIRRASREAPEIFQACCSASGMWTANAATVSPSADSEDGRVHITPANLCSRFHRSIEHPTTARVLRAIFPEGSYFVHHPPLPAGEYFGDEGAANHTRLCTAYDSPGVQLFVFGRYGFALGRTAPGRFPARQTYEASVAIARLHRLRPSMTVFAQQNPAVIDAGVFHNDVIAVGNRDVLFFHNRAFLERDRVVGELHQKLGTDLRLIEVQEEEVSVEQAVRTYLFNSQLLSLPDGHMAMVVPTECEEDPTVHGYLERMASGQTAIAQILYTDLRESMRNGGGPACLRQRIVLTQDELACANPAVFLDDKLYARLCEWVQRHYRERLEPEDLADPQLLLETRVALDELTETLALGPVYPFQL